MAEVNDKAVRFNMSMSKTLADKLEVYAKENGLPKSSIVNVALADYFKQRDLMENGLQMVMQMFQSNPEFFKQFIDENKK